MPRALVFINTKYDNMEIINALTKVEGVREAHSSRGMYDAVAMVQAESYSKVKEIVTQRIRTMENVKATLTLTLVESAAI